MNTPVSGGAVSDAQLDALWSDESLTQPQIVKRRSIARAVLALTQPAVPVLASEPDGEVYSASCDYATVQWFKPNDKAGGDPKNSWSWPIKGTKVYLAAPLASEPEPVAAEQAREPADPWREHLAKQAEHIDGAGLQLALTWMGSAHAGEGQEGFAAQLAENVNRLIRAVASHKCATLASQSTPPPESAGQGLSDAAIDRLWTRYRPLGAPAGLGAPMAFARAILAANRLADSPRGSR